MKIAVVLYNLGGPDRAEDVQSFLFNLFNDPMIIAAPAPIRWCLAKFISARRAPVAQEIYKNLGGGSPLLANTRKQAEALQNFLTSSKSGNAYRCFVAMRYWRPECKQVVQEVQVYGPDKIILLPLYPQFSTTTTGSFLRVWRKCAGKIGLTISTSEICCYPGQPGFVSGVADLIRDDLTKLKGQYTPRILFSAHGLPEKIIQRGDPYQWQVEQTAQSIVEALDIPGLDWVVCYQSKVGPLEWIKPSTEDEIRRAGVEGRAVIVVPLAFVSEHSETLVELDIEYRELANDAGVPQYLRTPTIDAAEAFISGLGEMVEAAARAPAGLASGDGKRSGGRICSPNLTQCPCAVGQ